MKVLDLVTKLTEEIELLILENENLKIQNTELLEALLRYRKCLSSCEEIKMRIHE